VAADIGSADARAEVFTRTLDEFGPGRCARQQTLGSAIPGSLVRTEESTQEFARVARQPTSPACFGLCQAAGSAMLARGGGSIVNIGSILGLVGITRATEYAYSASKGAVSSLTRALAVQWANRGVRVNCLAPGFFPTEMNTEMFQSEAAMKWLRRMCPAGRPGAIAELDAALLFLLRADIDVLHWPGRRCRRRLDRRVIFTTELNSAKFHADPLMRRSPGIGTREVNQVGRPRRCTPRESQ